MFEIYLSLILKGLKSVDDMLERDRQPFKLFCEQKVNSGYLNADDFNKIFNA